MKCLFLTMMLMCLFGQTCCAVDVQQHIFQEISGENLEQSVPDDVMGMISGYDILTGDGFNEVMDQLKDAILKTVTANLETAWKPAFHVLLIIVTCSLFAAMTTGGRWLFPITLSGGTAIVFLTLSDSQSLFADCVNAVQGMYDFSTALLPCLAAASAFTGATVSAGVKYTAAALFMNILFNFSNTVMVPLITLYLICVVGNMLFEQNILGVVSNFIRWLCMTVLTGSVVVFTTYLGVAGLITSTGDALTARVTKTALSAGLPVVGRIISDTASTLVAGAAVLRNGIGVFGMLAVLGILLIPFINLGIRYLLFKAVGEISDLFPSHYFSSLIRGIASAYGMLLGVIGTGFVMLFLTLISFMQLSGG